MAYRRLQENAKKLKSPNVFGGCLSVCLFDSFVDLKHLQLTDRFHNYLIVRNKMRAAFLTGVDELA